MWVEDMESSDSNPLSLGARPRRTTNEYEWARSVIPNNYATVGEAAQILGRTPGRVRSILAKDHSLPRQLVTRFLKTSDGRTLVRKCLALPPITIAKLLEKIFAKQKTK